FFAGFNGQAIGLSASSGRSFWSRDISAYGGVALAADQVYVADAKGVVHALSRSTGTTVWKQEGLGNRWLTTPVVHGGQVVVGDLEGYLHWLSPAAGSFSARDRVSREPLRGAALASGYMLWVLTPGGDLVAYRSGS